MLYSFSTWIRFISYPCLVRNASFSSNVKKSLMSFSSIIFTMPVLYFRDGRPSPVHYPLAVKALIDPPFLPLRLETHVGVTVILYFLQSILTGLLGQSVAFGRIALLLFLFAYTRP